jgi:hypothetical protein
MLTVIPGLFEGHQSKYEGRNIVTNLFPLLLSDLHWASTPNQDEVHILSLINRESRKKLEETHRR